jgi:hypothetical protein
MDGCLGVGTRDLGTGNLEAVTMSSGRSHLPSPVCRCIEEVALFLAQHERGRDRHVEGRTNSA